jgi:hypothetical protein
MQLPADDISMKLLRVQKYCFRALCCWWVIMVLMVPGLQAQIEDQIGREEEPVEATEAPDSVMVGVYFTSLYDLDLAAKSFNVDFWLWFNYTNDSLKPMETVEIANAKDFSFSLPDTEEKEGKIWACHKCRAVIKKEWNLEHFPFDKQYLDVRIEDAIMDFSTMRYVPDIVHTTYDKSIQLDEWVIRSCTMKQDDKMYQTNFGNPELGNVSVYPAVTASFELHRNGLGLFFKLFVGIYVAYVISCMVFFMGPDNHERFGLTVGAMFAAVANKYIVDGLMPRTIHLTLPDKIHNVTFAFIILHLVVTVVAHRLARSERIRWGWRVDRVAFLVSLVAYFAINWMLVDSAVAYL